MKEATGALRGDEAKNSEGRSDQRKGALKEKKEKKGAAKDLLK